ncbi:MAG: ATP-binding protein [Deltaproteobacteria bacterium]|nr:ATP-binding protein [Deltaproteobacteria bacterium]
MKDRTLFAICPDAEFFGRTREIGDVLARASAERRAPNVFLAGKRWTGKTEVLRRIHRELFWSHSRVVPVYYQFKGPLDPEAFAEDYLKEFIKQYLAFRKREPDLVRNETSLERLERILFDEDAFGLLDFTLIHREAKRSNDKTAVLRNALGAIELMTRRTGTPVYLMLDDIGESLRPSGHPGPSIERELAESLNSGSFPFIAASSTRAFLEGGLLGSVERMSLDGLDADTSVAMMAELCRSRNIAFDTEILSLAAMKLGGNPMYMKSMVWAALKGGRDLKDLKSFVELYSDEVFEGNIAFALKSSLKLKGPSELRMLYALIGAGGARADDRAVSGEDLRERFRLSEDEFSKAASSLAAEGLAEFALGSVKWAGDSTTADFVSYMFETRIKGRGADEFRTSFTREALKEGFIARGARVRGRLKEDAGAALRSFNGQKLMKILFRNQAFSLTSRNGGWKPGERKDSEDLALPEIIGSFDSSRWEKGETGPAIIIAHGFANGRYDAGNEVVWMTAVKDSPSPVNIGDVENFLRRGQILKENFRTTRIVRWFVGRDGFTAEAQKRLEGEGVHTSDSVQLNLIRESLEDASASERLKRDDKILPMKEFEVVLPSSTKAELVAVKAVEEIGTEMGFGDNAIGQIKAALVEACINAFEHSKVKAGKVFLRFVAGGDRLTIHVQNGGVDFDSPAAASGASAETDLPRKRGWGFELMKGLMDEVRLERINGGARIVLVKYLIKKGETGGSEA